MRKVVFFIFLGCFMVLSLSAQSWQQLNDIGSNRSNTFVPDIGGDVAKFTVSEKAYFVGGQTSGGLTNKVYQFDFETYQWLEKNDFPDLIGTPVAFVVNNIAYVGSGYSGNNKALNKKFWKYIEATDSWVSIADIPVARAGAVAFTIQGKGYVGTGSDSTSVHMRKEFFEYDPELNSWKAIADFAGEGRSGAMAFTLNNFGYVGTGISSSPSATLFNDFWKYNPQENTWQQIANYPGSPRYHCMQFVLNNIPFVGCGTTLQFFNAFKDFCYYNDTSNTWVNVIDFPFALNFGIAFSNNVHAVVGRGTSGQTTNPKMFEYNQAKNQWDFFRESHGTYGAASFVLNGIIYVVGGQTYDLGVNTETWAYDISKKEWQKRADFPGSPRRYDLKGFALAGNGYLVAGSINGVTPSADCWKYTVETNTWSQIDSLPVPRTTPVTFVINNKGYVCSGRGVNGLLNDLWEYDPQTGHWLQKDSMPCAGRQQAAAFSIDSMAYIIGGNGWAFSSLNDVWCYNAITNKWQQKNNFNVNGIYVASATASDNIGFLMNGRDGKSSNYFTQVWRYEPSLDRWSQCANNSKLPIVLGVAEMYQGKIYMGLGSSLKAQYNATFFELEPNGINEIAELTESNISAFKIETPFAHQPKLFFTNLKPGKYLIKVFDLSGRQLLNNTQIIESSNGVISLEGLDNAANGMLVFQINGFNQSVVLRSFKLE